MTTQNFTAIDDLVQQYHGGMVSLPKEVEPVLTPPEKYHLQEVVEHEPEEEVKPFIQIKPESIKLPPDLQKLGLKPISNTQFQSYKNIKLPISDDKIVIGLHAPITTSIRWLATFAKYLLQRAHLTLKVVHGRVVRIFSV